MIRGIPAGRVAGVPLRIGLSWLVVVPLVGVALFAGIPSTLGPTAGRVAVAAAGTLLVFVSVIVHEVGHVLAARRHGVAVSGTAVFLVGGWSEMDLDRVDPATEMWVAAAGPLASAGLAAVLGGLALVLPDSSGVFHVARVLALVNAAVAALNLLPGFPLDGGRVVRGLLRSVGWSDARAERITAWVGVTVGAVLLALGSLAVLEGRPLAIVLVPSGALVLLLGVVVQPSGIVRVREVMLPAPPPLTELDPLGGATVAEVPIPVVSGARVIGLVPVDAPRRGLAGEAMVPVLPGDVVAAHTVVDDIAGRRRAVLVVDEAGRLLGIVPAAKEI